LHERLNNSGTGAPPLLSRKPADGAHHHLSSLPRQIGAAGIDLPLIGPRPTRPLDLLFVALLVGLVALAVYLFCAG
jgi:hypothetical protein